MGTVIEVNSNAFENSRSHTQDTTHAQYLKLRFTSKWISVATHKLAI